MGGFFTADKLQIISFRTYGDINRLYVRGRALEDEEIDLSKKGFFHLIQNSWKRFETDEIRNTPIFITLPDGRIINGQTDKNGYFLINEPVENLEALTDSEGWLDFKISYVTGNLKNEISNNNSFSGEMIIPPSEADYGLISDIDDTILHTGVVSWLKWQVIINTFFKQAKSRRPIEGTANLYRLFKQGPSKTKSNPIFYVSHSPWNLYRYLVLFLKLNYFPKGAILLRSMSDITRKNTGFPQKQIEIEHILRAYTRLPFILFGDSGEKDADIYMAIATAYPKQIKAIYLRSVNHKRKMKRIHALVETFTICPILVVSDSAVAVAHAKKHGLL